jgi:hypothetical protein
MTKEIVFIQVKGHDSLHRKIKSSEKSSIHKKGGQKPGMEYIGKDVEINNLDKLKCLFGHQGSRSCHLL